MVYRRNIGKANNLRTSRPPNRSNLVKTKASGKANRMRKETNTTLCATEGFVKRVKRSRHIVYSVRSLEPNPDRSAECSVGLSICLVSRNRRLRRQNTVQNANAACVETLR